MKSGMRRFWMGLLFLLAMPCCAQEWTANDSLRVQRWLEQEGEIQLQRLPELDSSMGTPLMDSSKPWLNFDTSLPKLQPQAERPKVRLTLRPYSAHTRYDYDPVYQQRIKVDKDTWRSDPMASFKRHLVDRGTQVPVQNPSGIDLMTLFTRDFWHFRARAASQRTKEVLKHYGQE
ncbi:MAG: DUF4858 domain-containing protein [Bacteroides sp.]